MNGRTREHNFDHVCNQTMSMKEVPEILRNPDSWGEDCWILPDFHLSSGLMKNGLGSELDDGKQQMRISLMVSKPDSCPQNSKRGQLLPWASTTISSLCEVQRTFSSKSSPCTVLHAEEYNKNELGFVYQIEGATHFRLSFKHIRKSSFPWFPEPTFSVIPYNENIQRLSEELFHRTRGETPVFRTVCFHIRGAEKTHLVGATDLFISWALSQAGSEGDENSVELRHGYKSYEVVFISTNVGREDKQKLYGTSDGVTIGCDTSLDECANVGVIRAAVDQSVHAKCSLFIGSEDSTFTMEIVRHRDANGRNAETSLIMGMDGKLKDTSPPW